MATAAEDETKLPEDYSCGYCLQRSAYMTDPRALPCSHVFCLPCIQTDYRQLERVDCAICGRSHDIQDFKALKKVSLVELEQRTDDNGVVFIQCDLCKESKSESVAFCSDCGKKLCRDHLKVHDELMASLPHKSHSIISIEDHAKNQKDTCKEHDDQPLRHACSKCHRIFCAQCDATGDCDGEANNESSRERDSERDSESGSESGENDGEHDSKAHVIVPLEKLAQKLREEIKKKMRRLSEKVSHICKQEKLAWKNVSEIEIKAEQKIREVDVIVEEQIARLKTTSTKFKEKIYQNRFTNIKQQGEYSAHAAETKAELENVWRSYNKQLAQNRDVAVVEKQSENMKTLKQAISSEVEPCPQLFKVLGELQLPTCEKPVEKFAAPKVIEYRQMIDCSQGAHGGQLTSTASVCWTLDGNLLCASVGKLSEYNSLCSQLKSFNHQFDVNSVAHTITGFVGITRNSAACDHSNLMLFDTKLQPIKFVDDFMPEQMIDDKYNTVTVIPFTNEIVVIAPSGKALKGYSKEGEFMFTNDLSSTFKKPSAIHALKDGCVLVADCKKNGRVRKCSLGPKELQCIWTCSGVCYPTAISSDAFGFIYCLGETKSAMPAIFIISEEGKLLTNIIHQSLSNWTRCDMAVSKDDKLAIACKEKGVAMFDITRGDC